MAGAGGIGGQPEETDLMEIDRCSREDPRKRPAVKGSDNLPREYLDMRSAAPTPQNNSG